jgi:hypothetical protein
MEGNVASSEHGGVVSVVLVVDVVVVEVVVEVVVVEVVVVDVLVVDDVVVVDVLVVDDVVVVDGGVPNVMVATNTRLYVEVPGVIPGGTMVTTDSETTGV